MPLWKLNLSLRSLKCNHWGDDGSLGAMGEGPHPQPVEWGGTWFGKCQMTVDLCDKVQNFFWRVMLGVPESCLKVALQYETKILGMKWRIWQENILLMMRIKNHEMDTLCRQVYEEGRSHNWPVAHWV